MNVRDLTRLITPSRVAGLAEKTLSPVTVPFREEAVVRAVESFASERPWVALKRDPDGNLHLSRRGARRTASPAVFSAHMDHPGFISRKSVRGPRGFRVAADFLGGVADAYFAGAKVRFFPSNGPPVAALVLSQKKDPRTGDRRTVLSSDGPVPPGTPGMWDLPPFRRERDLLISRAVDDLAGVTAILTLFDVLPGLDPRGRSDVRGLLTRGEEVGFWGAIGASRSGRIPKGASVISLEASKALSHAPLGAGPILRAGDRASVFSDSLTRSLAAAAARLADADKDFRWQRKLMDGGTCEGTAYQAYGFRTGALCVPLRHYHNMGGKGRIAPEAARLSDLTGMTRWMAVWALAGAAAPPPLRGRMEAYYQRWKGR